MTDKDHSGWEGHRDLVLAGLQDQKERLEEHKQQQAKMESRFLDWRNDVTTQLVDLKVEVARLQVRGAMWSAGMGILFGAGVSFLVSYFGPQRPLPETPASRAVHEYVLPPQPPPVQPPYRP